MSQGGYLEEKPRSPGGLAIVIAVHAAAIGALALSKMEVVAERFTPIKVDYIEPDEPPPPEPPPEPIDQKVEIRPKTSVDRVDTVVPTPPRQPDVIFTRGENVKMFDPGPTGEAEAQKPADPPKPPPPPQAEPVRTSARLSPRSELQPPYPAGEQQRGTEGSVTVRLTIGADGRVKAVEKVRATSDGFFRATERHALRRWRFEPATLDGKPIESRMTMTVDFRLDG